MSKTLTWTGHVDRPWTHPVRHVAALVLRSGSLLLARAARRVRPSPERTIRWPEVEFHALYHEAGAPEGALYVDGELIAVLPVTRL